MPKQIITIEVEIAQNMADNFTYPGSWNWEQIVRYWCERQWGFTPQIEVLQAASPTQTSEEIAQELAQHKEELKAARKAR